MRTKLVAKAIILNSTGELLALRRSQDDDSRPGEGDLPGGKVEEGKYFAAATQVTLSHEHDKFQWMTFAYVQENRLLDDLPL